MNSDINFIPWTEVSIILIKTRFYGTVMWYGWVMGTVVKKPFVLMIKL